jgi:hypothetical protein
MARLYCRAVSCSKAMDGPVSLHVGQEMEGCSSIVSFVKGGVQFSFGGRKRHVSKFERVFCYCTTLVTASASYQVIPGA